MKRKPNVELTKEMLKERVRESRKALVGMESSTQIAKALLVFLGMLGLGIFGIHRLFFSKNPWVLRLPKLKLPGMGQWTSLVANYAVPIAIALLQRVKKKNEKTGSA